MNENVNQRPDNSGLGVPPEVTDYQTKKENYIPPTLEEKLAAFRSMSPENRARENRHALKSNIITFEFADSGCSIQVGCKKICFSSLENGIEAFQKYVKSPVEERMKWIEIVGE